MRCIFAVVCRPLTWCFKWQDNTVTSPKTKEEIWLSSSGDPLDRLVSVAVTCSSHYNMSLLMGLHWLCHPCMTASDLLARDPDLCSPALTAGYILQRFLSYKKNNTLWCAEFLGAVHQSGLCVCVCVSRSVSVRVCVRGSLDARLGRELCDGEERLQRITKPHSALRGLLGNTLSMLF